MILKQKKQIKHYNLLQNNKLYEAISLFKVFNVFVNNFCLKYIIKTITQKLI